MYKIKSFEYYLFIFFLTHGTKPDKCLVINKSRKFAVKKKYIRKEKPVCFYKLFFIIYTFLSQFSIAEAFLKKKNSHLHPKSTKSMILKTFRVHFFVNCLFTFV